MRSDGDPSKRLAGASHTALVSSHHYLVSCNSECCLLLPFLLCSFHNGDKGLSLLFFIFMYFILLSGVYLYFIKCEVSFCMLWQLSGSFSSIVISLKDENSSTAQLDGRPWSSITHYPALGSCGKYRTARSLQEWYILALQHFFVVVGITKYHRLGNLWRKLILNSSGIGEVQYWGATSGGGLLHILHKAEVQVSTQDRRSNFPSFKEPVVMVTNSFLAHFLHKGGIAYLILKVV